MWKFIHKLGSPRYFYDFAGKSQPWLALLTILLLGYGLVGGLYLAPADFQQGDGFRIMYVHVPAAFLSLGIYSFMTAAAIAAFVWKIKLADSAVKVSAPVGAWFTALALITGSIWGKPMWGTYWVWDARLTSELILLFIYLGIIALRSAIPQQDHAARACGLFVMVGFVNIPIIHYSVYWWNTLHQGETLRLWGRSTIAPLMLHPLLAMIFAFIGFFIWIFLLRMRNEILMKERKTQWVQTLIFR